MIGLILVVLGKETDDRADTGSVGEDEGSASCLDGFHVAPVSVKLPDVQSDLLDYRQPWNFGGPSA